MLYESPCIFVCHFTTFPNGHVDILIVVQWYNHVQSTIRCTMQHLNVRRVFVTQRNVYVSAYAGSGNRKVKQCDSLGWTALMNGSY
jgi:hypothetical protein